MTLIQILESRGEALNVHQMAELLGVSERHIYELAAGGTIPAFRVGKAIRFDPQDVADWLRKKKPPNKQNISPRLAKHEDLKSHPGEQTNISTAWRNKIRSLELALAIDSSSSRTSTKNH